MTTVHISLGRDDGTDQTAAKGVVEWEPTTRREDGTMVILERGFVAPLVDGEATVTVDPSGLTWCWRVTERTDSGGTVRYVSVPDSATTVEYVDLPDVDPTTLVAWSPADPEAAYQTALDNLDVETAVETYLLANPVSAPVTSVNAQTGAVTLNATDVGADPAGTAAWLVGALEIPDSPDDIGAASASHSHVMADITDYAAPDLSGYVTTTDPRLTDARTPTSHTHAASEISDSTTTGRSLITAATATAARTAISAAPALGSDDNYVTDAEKAALHSHANKSALDQVSGINTGDQDLSGLLTTAAAPELMRDTMASALVAGTNVTITPDDNADTITIAAASALLPGFGLNTRPGKYFSWVGCNAAQQVGQVPDREYGIGVSFAPIQIDALKILVSVVGDVGSILRVGLRPITTEGIGAPVLDVTFPLDVLGYQLVTLGTPVDLSNRLYALSWVRQADTSTATRVKGYVGYVAGTFPLQTNSNGEIADGHAAYAGVLNSSVTGALPSTAIGETGTGTHEGRFPLVSFRRSAA